MLPTELQQLAYACKCPVRHVASSGSGQRSQTRSTIQRTMYCVSLLPQSQLEAEDSIVVLVSNSWRESDARDVTHGTFIKL